MNRGSEDKRDPRKHVNTITSREVTSALELRAETTFLLVPLLYHKRKRRKEKKRKRNKYSLKTFSSFPLFFLISDFPPLRKCTTCKGELLNIQIQVDVFLFDKNCLNIRCSLFVLCWMKFFLIVCSNTPKPNQQAIRTLYPLSQLSGLIMIIIIFSVFHCTFLFVNNHLFAQLYDSKYSYLIQIVCIHLYSFKYSYQIQIIYTQLHGFKCSYLIIHNKYMV